MKSKKAELKDEIRALAEADLETFIKLVHPNRILGSVHKELLRWWSKEDSKSHQLVLLPRDHQKSALLAYRVAWAITRDPAVRVLYISSTANLAIKQLKFIKDILTCDQYRFYWPEMVNVDEAKREKWTTTEISVDHPKRKADLIRDPTVWAAGLTTNIVGMHCDIACMDDVVTAANCDTEEGRSTVQNQYGLLASIETAEAEEWIVGTRYDPNDLYNDLMAMRVVMEDEDGEELSSDPLYETFIRVVETNGEFLWPRQQTADGKQFGFNAAILATKKSKYINQTQFRAQYYNDPNDPAGNGISPDWFQYFDRKYLERNDGTWYFKLRRLNVFAAVDFAFSLAARADYTCIVVIGVDSDFNYYLLDIDRFKTTLIGDYFDHILRLHQKWDFRKIRAEVTAAQKTIVEDLKLNYIRRHGLALSVEDFRPDRGMGNKEERVFNILQPRYQNLQMWHYMGGNCELLEAELLAAKPPHDDIKDCLASVVDSAIAPSQQRKSISMDLGSGYIHNRFGGVA